MGQLLIQAGAFPDPTGQLGLPSAWHHWGRRGRGSDMSAASQSHLSTACWLAHVDWAALRLRLRLRLLGEVDLPIQAADPGLVGGQGSEDRRPHRAVAGVAKAVQASQEPCAPHLVHQWCPRQALSGQVTLGDCLGVGSCEGQRGLEAGLRLGASWQKA